MVNNTGSILDVIFIKKLKVHNGQQFYTFQTGPVA